MKGAELREAIYRLIEAHPLFANIKKVAYAHVFRTPAGKLIAVENRGKSFVNLWVASADVSPASMKGIDAKTFRAADYHSSRPNHDIFGSGGFTDVDVTCFQVQDIWQAVRVLVEIGGLK